MYLSLASRKALAKGLCLIFRAVICGQKRTNLGTCAKVWGEATLAVMPEGTDLFVLVGSDGNKLGFGERLAADHLLDASDLHDVYPGLVLV